ncbi:MAG TPA: carboxymuconolactone decarboxylase family protein [Bryobacteraceae bacterium]|jgi:AhpD family alkylhydroperoxidase|nr:carboxymuconolactone decarboxylase family protein [Bryobacteraceae bacterium]
MQIIQPIRLDDAVGSTRRLLETINLESGGLNNMLATMAQSPVVLESYLRFQRMLAAGSLSAELRQRIALTVAQANLCEYSLAHHTALAGRLGLSSEEIHAARGRRSGDRKMGAASQFARELIDRAGGASVVAVREAGATDAEIVEIIAQVALNVFENYFNIVAQTDPESSATPASVAA